MKKKYAFLQYMMCALYVYLGVCLPFELKIVTIYDVIAIFVFAVPAFIIFKVFFYYPKKEVRQVEV